MREGGERGMDKDGGRERGKQGGKKGGGSEEIFLFFIFLSLHICMVQ